LSKKWVFSILFVLLALTVSAHFLLQSTFFSKKLEGFAESALEKTLGKPVKVSGARLDLLSASVILEGLSVHPDLSDQGPLFFAKTLHAVFNPDSLFTEAVVIRKVRIDSPEIVLTDTVLTELLSSLKKSPAKNQIATGDAGAPSVIVRTIEMTEGQFSYAGAGWLKQATLSGIALEINPDLGMQRFELGLVAKQGAFSTKNLSRGIDRFEARVLIQADKIQVKNGRLVSGETEFSTRGVIDLDSEAPLALRLDLRLPIDPDGTPGLGPPLQQFLKDRALSGELIFTGAMTGAMPDVSLEGILAVPRFALANEDIGTLEAALLYDAGQLTLSKVSGKLFSGTFSGELQAPLAARSSPPDAEIQRNALQAALQYKDLPADRLMAVLPLSGALKPPLLKGVFVTGEMQARAVHMRPEDIQARGTLSAQRHALFSAPPLKDAAPLERGLSLFESGKLQWRWSSAGLVLNEATFDFPDLRLSLDGQWHPEKGYAFESALHSTDVSEVASVFYLPLTGALEVKGRVSGREGLPHFEGALSAKSGTLKGQFFSSFISELALKGRRLEIKKAALSLPSKKEKAYASPAGFYTASGSLDFDDLKNPGFDIKLKVQNGNPQEVFRFLDLEIPLYASAKGSLFIQGKPAAFFVKGPLEVSSGSLYGETFEAGRVDLTVTEKEVLLENVVLRKQNRRLTGSGGIAYDETYWLNIKGDRLNIADTVLSHRMPASLSAVVGLAVSGKGSFSEPQIRFVAAVEDLRYGELHGIQGTITADWVKKTVDFQADFPNHRLSMSGAVQLQTDYPFSFEGVFTDFQIDPFFSARPGPLSDLGLRASGNLRGSGTLPAWQKVNLSGHLEAVTADFGGYKLENDGPLPLLARNGTFSFQNARFKGENTALVLNGNLTVLERWGLFLKGEADLNLLTFFSKKITSGSGKVVLDLSVSDQWHTPRLRGELNMANGKLRAADLSQPIEVASFSALFNERQVILENLQGGTGGGSFRATGKAELSGFKVDRFSFLLELTKVRVDLAEDLPATIGGELFFQKKGTLQTLKGDLRLKNVIYEKRMDLRQFVLDFTKKERNALSEETPIIGQTLINIHLYGNEDIWIDNNLAKMPLVVDLLVKGSFDQPNLLGRIDIPEGDIYFRYNTFEIISGSVRFLDLEEINPTLELAARTNVRNIVTDRNYTIDLNLAGTLTQVTLDWSAFPALSDTDILSLLAIRKTTADLAQNEGPGAGAEATNFVVTEFLAEPVDQITGMVGEPVEQITGIDHIRVEPSIGRTNTKATVGTRLTAEKRLMKDRLIVIYTTTLDPSEEEVIRMVYEINKNVSLVGKREEDGQLGGDIRFRFEIR